MANTSNNRLRGITLSILLGVWSVGLFSQAGAQDVASRWGPWLGCWRPVEETAAAPPLLCVVPIAGEEAIEMRTVLDGRVVSRESIFADGQRHDVSRDDCEGWELAEFSGDFQRIYIRSELTCRPDGQRNSTGVISMVTPSEWLDIRTVDVEGRSAPWAARYRLASRADFYAAGQGDLLETQGPETQMARTAASIPIAISDVIEATGKLSTEALQLWVVERGEPFALDAPRLIEMADAGVPPNVIDVVVAVSYPEKFVVNERGPAGRRSAEAGRGGSSLGINRTPNPFEPALNGPFYDPFYDPYARNAYSSFYGSRVGPGMRSYGGFGYGFSGYGAGYGIGYGGGPGGYGFGGYNPELGGFGTPIVSVGRRSGYGPEEGRVTSDGGYTRVTNSSRGGSANTGRSARPRSSGTSGGSAARTTAPARSSSPSPQSTGRRAQPRSGSRN